MDPTSKFKLCEIADNKYSITLLFNNAIMYFNIFVSAYIEHPETSNKNPAGK